MLEVWFPIAVIFNLLLSWYVSSFCRRRCHSTSQRYRDHGSLEFHLAFFGLTSFMSYFVPTSINDDWIFAMIGLALLASLVKRFVQNWMGSERS